MYNSAKIWTRMLVNHFKLKQKLLKEIKCLSIRDLLNVLGTSTWQKSFKHYKNSVRISKDGCQILLRHIYVNIIIYVYTPLDEE